MGALLTGGSRLAVQVYGFFGLSSGRSTEEFDGDPVGKKRRFSKRRVALRAD